jgi:UDP-N-acetyl-D-glucosamine dehydrogenase
MQIETISLISKKKAKIGIIGLGYVGIPLVLRYIDEGFSVTGFDVDSSKIGSLNDGKSYIEHISDYSIHQATTKGFKATSDFKIATEMDALIICVPTPLNKHREPDISYIVSAMKAITPYLRKGQVISLESTTYPGTTEEVLRPAIESCGLEIGRDVFLVFSPEREDPGRKDFNTKTTPKVCGGSTPTCLEVGVKLYEVIVDKVVKVSSTKAAEMTKLLENIHRAVNIGLVNEMKIIAQKMGIDIYEVIDAAATKPFGFVPYYPGPGLGGHCIPIDPFYLTWKAKEYGVNAKFIELAGEINSSMPSFVVDRVVDALNLHSKPARGSKVLILGVAYKKNVDDMRESPAIEIIERLHERGAKISYSDPHVPVFDSHHHHSQLQLTMKSLAVTAKNLEEFDCVVLVTDHKLFDYDLISKHSKLVVDTRGTFRMFKVNTIQA